MAADLSGEGIVGYVRAFESVGVLGAVGSPQQVADPKLQPRGDGLPLTRAVQADHLEVGLRARIMEAAR